MPCPDDMSERVGRQISSESTLTKDISESAGLNAPLEISANPLTR